MVSETRVLDKLDEIERRLDSLVKDTARDIVLRGFDKNNLIVNFVDDDRAFAISPIDIHYLGLRIVAVDWNE